MNIDSKRKRRIRDLDLREHAQGFMKEKTEFNSYLDLWRKTNETNI